MTVQADIDKANFSAIIENSKAIIALTARLSSESRRAMKSERLLDDRISNYHEVIDSELSMDSENPVQNRVIYRALQEKLSRSAVKAVAISGSYRDLLDKPAIPVVYTIDMTLSETSENPVANRIIKAALDLKANDADLSPVAKSGDWNDLYNLPTDPELFVGSERIESVVDTVPTEGNTLRVVCSDGVYTAVESVRTVANDLSTTTTNLVNEMDQVAAILDQINGEVV